MARRKTYPVENELLFTFVDNGGGYIDLAQCLSIVNRRAYRQKMLYYVAKVEWIPDALPGGVAFAETVITCAPNNWAVENSIQKSFCSLE